MREALERTALRHATGAYVAWVGQSIWPYPDALRNDLVVEQSSGDLDIRAASSSGEFDVTLSFDPSVRARDRSPNSSLVTRSLFIDPQDSKSRNRDHFGQKLWAIDHALRCPGITAVIADGSGLPMAATRRLQLAARETGVLVLCLRPPHEVHEISAATTRWQITREPERDGPPGVRWRVTLLRAKGAQDLCRSA